MQRFLISAFALFLAVGGCAADSADDAESSEDEIRTAVLIGDADNGKTFTVEKGKDVQLVLKASLRSPNRWKVVSTSSSFGYPTPRAGQYQAPPGEGGRQTFRWKTSALAASSSTHTVKLEYRWEFESDDSPPDETFTFKIKIKGGATPPPASTKPIVLEEEHANDTVRAKEGQDIVVRLPENPTTGYRWYVTSVDRTLGQPTKTFEADQSGRAGAGGTGVFTWKTTDGMVGSHSIALKYSRRINGAADKTFKFKLNILAAAEDDAFECPPESRRSINCMPPVRASSVEFCKADYRAWAEDNCDVGYLD